MLEVSVWISSPSLSSRTTLFSVAWTCSSKCHLNRCLGEDSCPTLATQTSPLRCSITSSNLLLSNNLPIITSTCSVGSLNLASTLRPSNNSSQTSTNKLTLVNSSSNSKRRQHNRTIIWLTLTRWISSNNSRDKEEHGTLLNSRKPMYGRRVAAFLTSLT